MRTAALGLVIALVGVGLSSRGVAQGLPGAAASGNRIGQDRPAGEADRPASTYVLGPDDQIVIHAVDVPDISDKPQRLDPNGDLRLPMVGRIHATGMTLEQLEGELVKRLKVFVQEPDVAVTV